MANFQHKAITGVEIHEAFQYVQSSDPGTVGAGLYWLDTTNAGSFQLNKRDSLNAAWIPIAGGSAEVTGTDFKATGLTGAVHQTRFAGATTGGAPGTGTWVQGDMVTDYNGKIWLCTASGSPGTWRTAGGGGTLDIAFGGSGTTITNGVKGDFRIDADLQIIGWRIYADVVGSITIDIWKSTHAGFPPTIANTIVAAGGILPFISSAAVSQFTNLTNWTTTIAKGSVLRFNVPSATSITRCTLALEVLRI